MFYKKVAIIVLTVAGILSLVYSHDITQKNPETIFLTEKSLTDYKVFKNAVSEKHTLVIKKKTANKEEFYNEFKKIEELCVDECEIITQRKIKSKNLPEIPSRNGLMNLESDDYVAALILDNSDETHKKILHLSETAPYWNDELTSFAGIPYTNYLLDKHSRTIQENLFPLMFALGLIISIIFIGRLKNALVVYMPCLFSAGFSLAALEFLNGQMNMVTSIIPLVVFTVSLSLSFHLYYSLMELKNLKTVFKLKWAPIFLMMFTTYIGFLSLGWAEISVIRQFGLISSQLVLFSTLYTFLWYFLWENFLSTQVKKERKKLLLFSKVFNYSLKYRAIIVLAIIGLASLILVPTRLEVMTDATLYFPKDKKIREKIFDITKTVSGMPIMEVVIDLKHDFSNADIVKINELENGVLALSLSQPYKILSNNTLVRQVNQDYAKSDSVPQDINAYFLLRSQLPLSLQESYPVETNYRMTILGNPLNGEEYMSDLKKVTDYLDSKNTKHFVNGIHHNLLMSQNAMIGVLASSFVSSAVVIFILSAFFLKSLRNNLIFIFVSLLPVALTFGVIYFLGFSINIATVMTFSISLGLVGDSSFHIIYAKKVRFSNFEEYNRGVLSPVIGSGLLLCSCFGMFAFNDFIPIRQFGGILAIILSLGTIVDLYVLPTLIYKTNEHKKAYERH